MTRADGKRRLARSREIREADGIAVNGGVEEGRQIDWSDQVLGEDAAIRVEERDLLAPRRRRQPCYDPRQRLVD